MKLPYTFILVIVNFLIGPDLYAQSKVIDSLNLAISKTNDDTLKIYYLNRIADDLTSIDMKRAIHLCDSIVEISNQIDYTSGVIEALQTKGFIYAVSGRFELSTYNLDSALVLLNDFPDPRREAAVLYALGIAYIEQGYREKAVDYFVRAHDIKIAIGNPGELIKSYNGMANMYRMLGDYAKTLDAFNSALEISKSVDDTNLKFLPVFGLGNFYSGQGEFSKALEYQLEAEKLSEKLDDLDNRAKIILSLGGTYLRLGEFKTALDYYERGLELIKKIGQRNVIATTLRDISIVHKRLGNEEQVFSYLKQALDVYKDGDRGCDIIHVYASLAYEYIDVSKLDSADFYSRLAENKAESCNDSYKYAIALKSRGAYYKAINQVNQASDLYLKAFDLAKDKSYLKMRSDLAKTLSGIFEDKSDYKSALKFHRDYQITKDSIFNKENTRAITRLESKYQYEKEKEALVAEQEQQEFILNQKLERQRIIQYSAFGGTFLVMLLAINYYRSYRNKKKDNQLLEKKNEQIFTQAEALKLSNEQLLELSNFKEGLTHMIAHDMKNPLNVIIGLSDSKQTDKNLQSIHSSGKQILNMVTNMLDIQKFEQPEIELEASPHKLEGLLRNALVQVELLAHAKNIALDLNIHEAIVVNCNDDMIIRVIVNLLTNAIKYSKFDGHVIIKTEQIQSSDKVLIHIADEGQGISPEELPHVFEKFWQVRAKNAGVTKSTGLGLTYCKMAVEAHGCHIEVDSELQKGSKFTFSLPIHEVQPAESTSKNTHVTLGSIEPVILDSELQTLKSIASHLKKLKVYQASEINNIIEQLDRQDLQSNWKEQLKVAVYSCDEDKFEELVNMI